VLFTIEMYYFKYNMKSVSRLEFILGQTKIVYRRA
jgi:hypothetical protein